MAQISLVEAKIKSANDKAQVKELELQEIAIETSLEVLRESLATATENIKTKNRIKELEDEEKELRTKFAKLNDESLLVDKFIKRKIELLEASINEMFEITEFQLFKEQMNGEIKVVCETLYNGKPYGNLCGGERLNVGLDIIKAFQTFHKINVPIFINNRESVTKIIDMKDTQIINLIVSEKDKTLRMEVQNG